MLGWRTVDGGEKITRPSSSVGAMRCDEWFGTYGSESSSMISSSSSSEVGGTEMEGLAGRAGFRGSGIMQIVSRNLIFKGGNEMLSAKEQR